MKLSYELKAVCGILFDQVPFALDASQEKSSHVRIYFNQPINPALLDRQFSARLEKEDYYLEKNSLIIQKEGVARFNEIIKNHFSVLQMKQNHKKYAFVLNQVFEQRVLEINQLTPDSAILIRLSDENIDTKKFETLMLSEQSDFAICSNEINIFPSGFEEFNKAIDALYVDLSQKFLPKAKENSLHFRMFAPG